MKKPRKRAKITSRVQRQKEYIDNGGKQTVMRFKNVKRRAVRFFKKKANTRHHGKSSTILSTTQPMKGVMNGLSSFFSSLKLVTRVAKSFKLFQKLPPEIRIKIWRLAAPEPAVLSIMAPAGWDRNNHIVMAGVRKLPAMLMVNREAREEALQVFIPFFQPQLDKILYFDEKRDTLYFETRLAMETFFTQTAAAERRGYCERIRFVAFGCPCSQDPVTGVQVPWTRQYSLIAHILWQLPYLKEAFIIIHDIEVAALSSLEKSKMVTETYRNLNVYFGIGVRRYPKRTVPRIQTCTRLELETRMASGCTYDHFGDDL